MEFLDRGDAVNLAHTTLRMWRPYAVGVTPKGEKTMAEAILRMDEELKRLYGLLRSKHPEESK